MIRPVYTAEEDRYTDGMQYRRCGRSGIILPEISLGLLHAFDKGICHFDLANNYGPSYGSAESTFGTVMQSDLKPYRDELKLIDSLTI